MRETTRQLYEEVSELSDKIKIEVHDFVLDKEQVERAHLLVQPPAPNPIGHEECSSRDDDRDGGGAVAATGDTKQGRVRQVAGAQVAAEGAAAEGAETIVGRQQGGSNLFRQGRDQQSFTQSFDRLKFAICFIVRPVPSPESRRGRARGAPAAPAGTSSVRP
jgi:hypothetical protein